MVTPEPGLRWQIDRGVLTLTIDRPPVNALGVAEIRSIREVVDRAGSDDVHALVVRGAGRGFGAGNDRNEFPEDSATYRSHVSLVQAMVQAVDESPVLTVALVHGFCVGSCALLAAACDIVVAEETASFRFPEMEIGAPGGYRLLTERMPARSAREVLLSSRGFDALEARALGLVDRTVEPGGLDAAVNDYLASFGPGARWAGEWLPRIKQELARLDGRPLWLGYGEELDFGAALRGSRRDAAGG